MVSFSPEVLYREANDRSMLAPRLASAFGRTGWLSELCRN